MTVSGNHISVRYVLAVFLALVALGVSVWGAHQHYQEQSAPGAYVGERVSCGGGTVPYVASSRTFGDRACIIVIASSFANESSLVAGQRPSGDSDYMHNWGIQVNVYIPGWKQDRWALIGSINVIGSGCVVMVRAPNGGALAYLHLTCGVGLASGGYTGAPVRLPPKSALSGTPPKHMTNDDIDRLTLIAVEHALSRQPAGIRGTVVPGGTYVGLSRWPDSAAYGNGLAGPANAHLCIITTDLSSQWLYRYEHGMLHRTPPYHQKVWDAYLKPRHKKLISAYHKGKLTRAAQAWRSHQTTYRGIAAKHYYGKTATRHDAYTLWRWRCGKGYVWAKAIKLQKAACLK